MKELLNKLAGCENLTRAEAREAFERIARGEVSDVQIAALLVALRVKGETADEIAGAAEALRRTCLPLRAPQGKPLLDTCGTGGDGAGTFNISTAVALVAAACGATVAKHGNRSVSSKSGSADVLAAVGVNLEVSAEVTERCLAQVGVAFLFAPLFHPILKAVSRPRRELGLRTILNLLGPLANPAGARRQLLGVYHPDLLEPIGQALLALGSERALVVHGMGGLDELSPAGPTQAVRLEAGQLQQIEIVPEEAGVARCTTAAMRGGDPTENAARLLAILAGQRGPLTEAVVLNGAAALWAAGVVEDLAEGGQLARRALEDGRALAKLRALCAFTGGRCREVA